MRLGLREANQHFSMAIKAVRAGQEVILTERGQPIAVIKPIKEEQDEDAILKRMPGLPVKLHFFVFEPQALAIHVSLLVATAVIAALYPMWLVARLPIATTLRNEVIS